MKKKRMIFEYEHKQEMNTYSHVLLILSASFGDVIAMAFRFCFRKLEKYSSNVFSLSFFAALFVSLAEEEEERRKNKETKLNQCKN